MPTYRHATSACAGAIAACMAASCTSEPAFEGVVTRLDGSVVTETQIEGAVKPLLEQARLAGLQVAIVADGRIAYSRAFGVTDAVNPTPITDQTVFAANSFSKTFFAYVVLQLVDEGVIDLDEPLVSYLPKPLPEYDFYVDLAGEDRANVLTARMALSHTTGFPNWRWFTPEGRLHFIYEPGSRHGYSGEGFALLQLAVEELTGENLADLADSRIFEPLGMERSSFVFLPTFEDDFAMDHDHFLNPIGKQRRDEANAAGSAQTTAIDYARFLIAVMSGEGLSPATREEMFTRQVEIEHARMFGPATQVPEPPGAPDAGWGLGWGLVESEHGRAFFHTGNDVGSANYHVAFPDAGLAVVVFGNSQNVERITAELTALLIGDRYSPFEFLGYEPLSSPRGVLTRVMMEEGVEAGLARADEIPDEEVTRYHSERWELLDATAQDLVGLGHPERAVDLYRWFVEERPDMPFGHDRLGSALAATGDYEGAAEAFRTGLDAAQDPFWSDLYEWKSDWADAIADPYDVPASVLAEYVGVYETRHVESSESGLVYYREGTADPTPKPLYAVDETSFVFEGNDSFRMRFDRDAEGNVSAITGLYRDSDPDRTERTSGD